MENTRFFFCCSSQQLGSSRSTVPSGKRNVIDKSLLIYHKSVYVYFVCDFEINASRSWGNDQVQSIRRDYIIIVCGREQDGIEVAGTFALIRVFLSPSYIDVMTRISLWRCPDGAWIRLTTNSYVDTSAQYVYEIRSILSNVRLYDRCKRLCPENVTGPRHVGIISAPNTDEMKTKRRKKIVRGALTIKTISIEKRRANGKIPFAFESRHRNRFLPNHGRLFVTIRRRVTITTFPIQPRPVTDVAILVTDNWMGGTRVRVSRSVVGLNRSHMHTIRTKWPNVVE